MSKKLEELALVAELQGSVDKEVKKLKFYVEQVDTYRREADFEKVKRLVENTVPTKLNLIEDLIEKMTELRIDNEKSEEEVNEWIIRTRDSFSGCNRDISEATGELQQYYESIQQQRNRIQERMEQQCEDEIQRRLIEKRREQEEYEHRLEKEREQREYELLMSRRKFQLETKEKELEIEKKPQVARTKLPKLVIPKFKATATDWIRFKSMFISQIESEPISNIDKFSYLMELIGPKPLEVIGNIPMTDEGYVRAWEVLKEGYGQDQSVIVAHTTEIVRLPILYDTIYPKVREFYDKLSTNYKALKVMKSEITAISLI